MIQRRRILILVKKSARILRQFQQKTQMCHQIQRKERPTMWMIQTLKKKKMKQKKKKNKKKKSLSSK